jgi:DUF1680 family protein
VVVVEGNGCGIEPLGEDRDTHKLYEPPIRRRVIFKAIPYHLWNNRKRQRWIYG